ncbi:MAG TPA: ATP-binding protein [Vicinamibacterales bacterium]|nr:ATP-binding protein [Vicinamibacterales bacterium]
MSNPDSNEEFLAGFMDDYFAESDEHLTAIRRTLLATESSRDLSAAALEELFRSFHSIKGLSGMVELREAELLAHHMESYLRDLRGKTADLTPQGVSALIEGTHALEQTIAARKSNQPQPDTARVMALLAALTAPVTSAAKTPAFAAPITDPLSTDRWRAVFPPSAELAARGIGVDRIRSLLRALRVIDRNATAQARLIDDMLDMARIATGKLRIEMGPVDLVAATMAALDVVTPSAAAKGITIHRALGTRTQPILADSDRVQQIAWNVLCNAVKFTPKGGSIGVRIQQDEASTRLIVTDSGKGIEADFLPHVFERFRQANSSVNRTEGGLGLGLALVQQLVELHGGTITVSSAGAGHGSTFIITFPAVSDEALPLDLPLSAAPAVLASRHVLVVDDEEDWRDLLRQTFESHGASVVTAGSAPEALQLLKARDARLPDAIVADIGLPGEDGFTLIQSIRSAAADWRHIPAIAVTAYAGADKRRAALDAGFDSYRAKPISPDAVVTAVVELLKGDQFRSDVS